MLLRDRPRNKVSSPLLRILNENKIKVLLPATSLFETLVGMRNEQNSSTKKLQFGFKIPFYFDIINIDSDFFSKYYNKSLPYMKTLDMLYLSIAHKDGLVLITQDKELYKKGLSVGVEVYKTEQFIAKYPQTNH